MRDSGTPSSSSSSILADRAAALQNMSYPIIAPIRRSGGSLAIGCDSSTSRHGYLLQHLFYQKYSDSAAEESPDTPSPSGQTVPEEHR
jgi:hypothetical protein